MTIRSTLALGATLLASALTIACGSAQAAPHYYKNGTLLGSEPLPVISWGTLSARSEKGNGSVTCHEAVGGTIEDPENGEAGSGETEAYDSYDCELSECPPEAGLHAVLVAEGLPWPSTLLIEGSTVRQRTTGMKMTLECLSGTTRAGSQYFEGTAEPKLVRGTSALHPSYLEYDQTQLYWEFIGKVDQWKVEGKLKLLGYEEQEVLTAKSS